MSKFIKFFVRDERGVSAMEYAVLAGVVVLALVAGASTLSTSFGTMFTKMFANVTTAQAS